MCGVVEGAMYDWVSGAWDDKHMWKLEGIPEIMCLLLTSIRRGWESLAVLEGTAKIAILWMVLGGFGNARSLKNDPRMISKLPQNWSGIVSKLNCLKMVPTWPQNDPQLAPTSSPNCPKWFPKMVTICFEHCQKNCPAILA